MSALSARTYSCGGEGARFFFAGGESGFAAPACLKYASRLPGRMGAEASSSSVDNGEERSERPEVDMVHAGRG